jgi:hypothetical protein
MSRSSAPDARSDPESDACIARWRAWYERWAAEGVAESVELGHIFDDWARERGPIEGLVLVQDGHRFPLLGLGRPVTYTRDRRLHRRGARKGPHRASVVRALAVEGLRSCGLSLNRAILVLASWGAANLTLGEDEFGPATLRLLAEARLAGREKIRIGETLAPVRPLWAEVGKRLARQHASVKRALIADGLATRDAEGRLRPATATIGSGAYVLLGPCLDCGTGS